MFVLELLEDGWTPTTAVSTYRDALEEKAAAMAKERGLVFLLRV